MALDEPKENEKTVKVNDIDLLIAEFARPFLDDATVDYVKQPDGEGFVINKAGGCC